MLSGQAARERSVCDAEDETAVSAGVPVGGGAVLRAGVRTPKQLAAELGCSEQTLRNWLRQDEADRGERDDVLSLEERQRLRELERENKVLRQEREILKRAAAFFARETDRP
jgi:transposase